MNYEELEARREHIRRLRKSIDININELRVQITALDKRDKELFHEAKDLFDQMKKLDYDRTKKKYPYAVL